MTVLLFGATGMIGTGALHAALADDRVERVVSVVRRPSGVSHPKLHEIIQADMTDLGGIAATIATADTCLYCLGISSVGQSEADYRRITVDLVVSVAQALAKRNPDMTFVHVSGRGSNSSRTQMWVRVKGEAEKALLEIPFRAVYNARPGFIQPLGTANTRTGLPRAIYRVTGSLMPVLRRVVPNAVLDTDELGRALVEAGLAGAPEVTLEVPALQLLAERAEQNITTA